MRLRHIHKQGFGQDDDPPDTHAENSMDFRPHPDNVRRLEDTTIVVRFDRFGPGQHPRTYDVEINWLDVKWLLAAFAEAENAHALHLLEILKMSRGLDNGGWH